MNRGNEKGRESVERFETSAKYLQNEGLSSYSLTVSLSVFLRHGSINILAGGV